MQFFVIDYYSSDYFSIDFSIFFQTSSIRNVKWSTYLDFLNDIDHNQIHLIRVKLWNVEKYNVCKQNIRDILLFNVPVYHFYLTVDLVNLDFDLDHLFVRWLMSFCFHSRSFLINVSSSISFSNHLKWDDLIEFLLIKFDIVQNKYSQKQLTIVMFKILMKISCAFFSYDDASKWTFL